ncbi:ribonuclease P protein component [Candidatus Solincola sp.]|nr:ribonuclease P protein component [Actinomycetota bacterium]
METLKKSRDFKRVLQGGDREKLENIVIFALPNPEGPTRIGISVTRRVGGSVRRNRIKRRIREAVWRNASLLPRGVDMVILAGAKCYDTEFNRIERDIKVFIERWKEREERRKERR